MPKRVDLVVIDPQNSFCKVVPANEQQDSHNGELCVTGAWDDMIRVAQLVKKMGGNLNDIHVTLDSHHFLHIAHPIWFMDSKGNHPSPFTIISEKEGQIVGSIGGKETHYTTKIASELQWTLDYLKALAANKKYPHCIWPPHCLIGTPGHNIVAPLQESLLDWCAENTALIDFVTKGSNYHVEHFSAVRSEVADPKDPTTQINSKFIDTLMKADEILFAGEAGSHCLRNTVYDIAEAFGDDAFVKKCVLLLDGTSPVTGFEQNQTDFVNEMTKRGMKTTTCKDYVA